MAHHGYCSMAATSRKKGAAEDLLGEHAQGDYEPKAALVELGVGHERSRRKGSNND